MSGLDIDLAALSMVWIAMLPGCVVPAHVSKSLHLAPVAS
jgi:hypothetical protein